MQRPADFVAAYGAITVDALGLLTFRFGDNDAEVVAALWAGAGEIDSHPINLTLPVRPFNVRAAYQSNPCIALLRVARLVLYF
jgi:hypothetical protein